MTETTAYDDIGGEAGVRRLVERFYALMDELPEAKACRDIHPADLSGSAQKLFEYLTGWLGGPQLFVQRHGPPMLRRRHLHVAIGGAEIDGLLICFMRAWNETVKERDLDEWILPQIDALARQMRNREG